MPQTIERAADLAQFFHGSESKLGIFYPTGYLVAAFPSLETAQSAERSLDFKGFSREALAVEGNEVVLLAREERQKHGLWGVLMKELSRMIATEEVYTDHDLELAKAGASFLIVHCPSEERRHEAWEIIEPFGPIVARHYALNGIEHFKGEV